ncbi:hypothetical protein SNEBB_001257 [Seison nebaliae]|nr:hypothetical protein SNEBB_001257 [Seison nebaliae]
MATSSATADELSERVKIFQEKKRVHGNALQQMETLQGNVYMHNSILTHLQSMDKKKRCWIVVNDMLVESTLEEGLKKLEKDLKEYLGKLDKTSKEFLELSHDLKEYQSKYLPMKV